MRILQVIHGYPPASLGGAEIYAHHLALELTRRRCQVGVVAPEGDPGSPEYRIREETLGPIQVYRINNTFGRPQHWRELYSQCEPLDQAFERIFARFRPDLVHIHHLSGLSTGVPKVARQMGARVVFTLHDFWYMCPRGQLLRHDLNISETVDSSRCATCLAPALAAEEGGSFKSLLRELEKAETEVGEGGAEPSLVRYAIAGEALDGVFAHPPLSFSLSSEVPDPRAVLSFAMGFSPDVFSEDKGEGVTFRVKLNDEVALEELIDPKRNPEHRRWHYREIPLEAHAEGTVKITFETQPENAGVNEHNAAVWGDVRIGPSRLKKIEGRGSSIREELSEAKAVICPSADIKRRYVEWGLPEDKLLQADYGFDPAQFEGFERPDSDVLRVGFLGTIIPSKGVHVLVDGFRRANIKDAELHVWGRSVPYHGDESYLPELKKQAEGLNVTFHDAVPPDRVKEAFASMDVMVAPSLWPENSPLTVHEAFLTGTPVVASDIGGMAELIEHEETGLLFPPGDAVQLSERLRQLATDPRLRLKLSKPRKIRTLEEDAQELLDLAF